MRKTKKLRVAVVAACPFPHERGTPVRIRRLAEGLAARGHDIHVATYHLGDAVDLPGVRTHRIRSVAAGRPLIARFAGDFCPLTPDVSARPGIRSLFKRLTSAHSSRMTSVGLNN